jgi:hypothetical protein
VRLIGQIRIGAPDGGERTTCRHRFAPQSGRTIRSWKSRFFRRRVS